MSLHDWMLLGLYLLALLLAAPPLGGYIAHVMEGRPILVLATNTNWQGYAGESTMTHHLTQWVLRYRISSPPPPASRSPWP